MCENRKSLTQPLLFIALSFICFLIYFQPVQAASQKSKALKAYNAFLSKMTTKWYGAHDTEKCKLNECEFALVYINNDNIPELVLSNSEYCHWMADSNIYTYRNGKVVYVDYSRDEFCYYKKTGIYRTFHLYLGSHYWYNKLKNGKTATKLSSDLNIQFDGKLHDYYYKNTGTKNITLSKSSFRKELKKLVGTKKATRPKYYKNTKANRKKYLK